MNVWIDLKTLTLCRQRGCKLMLILIRHVPFMSFLRQLKSQDLQTYIHIQANEGQSQRKKAALVFSGTKLIVLPITSQNLEKLKETQEEKD